MNGLWNARCSSVTQTEADKYYSIGVSGKEEAAELQLVGGGGFRPAFLYQPFQLSRKFRWRTAKGAAFPRNKAKHLCRQTLLT